MPQVTFAERETARKRWDNLKNQTEKQRKRNLPVIVLSVLLFAALAAVIILLLRSGKNAPEQKENSASAVPSVIGGGEPIPEEQNKAKDYGVTHLPAYGELSFIAGTKEQTTVLQNPGENTCLIRISLILADGTTIYTSELVQPGYYTKPITLVAPMERGIYRGVTLQYECFTDDGALTPLNGAVCELDITVK